MDTIESLNTLFGTAVVVRNGKVRVAEWPDGGEPVLREDLFHLGAPYYHEAAMIGRVLVEEKLAACANIVEGIRSILTKTTAHQRYHHLAEALLVAQAPGRAVVLDRLGLDYCCHGGRSLTEACAAAGLDHVFDLLHVGHDKALDEHAGKDQQQHAGSTGKPWTQPV